MNAKDISRFGVTKRQATNWPMVVHTTDLLHITRENCKRGQDDAKLTACGKALTYAAPKTDLSDVDGAHRWKLCPRCGDRQAFEAVALQHCANLKERDARWAEESNRIAQEKADASTSKLEAFRLAFIPKENVDTEHSGPFALYVKLGDNVYRIQNGREFG